MCTYLDSDSDESDPPSIHGDVIDDNCSCDISDVEACSDEYLENEELFNRRYEEGYNIYSEPYAKWLLKNHPKETPTDWITRLNKIEKGIFKWYNLSKNCDTYICTYIHLHICVWFQVSQNQKALKTAQCIVTV